MIRLDIFFNRLAQKLKLFRKKIHYIGRNEALPPPLTKEEEEDL